MLAKRCQRYREERGALWRSVVSKYREDGRGWVPCMAPRHWLSGLWGNILKVEDVSNVCRKSLNRGLVLKFGWGIENVFLMMIS